LSYRGQQKGSYGAPYKKSRFSWGKPKKPKDKEVVYVRDDPEPKIPEETIQWTPKPLGQGIQILLSRPTTLTQNGAKTLLPTDLTQQAEIASQVSLLAESNQKLGLEVLSGDGSIRHYRIVKTASLLPTDKTLTYSDYPLIGNLKEALRLCGYSVIPN